MKKCNKCLIEKTIDSYSTYKNSKGDKKHKTICKECFNMMRKGITKKTNLTRVEMILELQKMLVM
jgi:hypothetical protein